MERLYPLEGTYDNEGYGQIEEAIREFIELYKAVCYPLTEKEKSIFKEAGANPLLWE